MSRIKPLKNEEVSQEVREIFQEIEQTFGMVPALFRTSAHFPPLLQANWGKVKAVLLNGNLSRKVKETIAVLVSKDNVCQYCIDSHTQSLKAIGMIDQEIEQIGNGNLTEAGFNIKEVLLISFARAANKNPHRIPDSDFKKMKESGIADAEIVEALGVMEIFAGFNKFLDSLEVSIDF